MAGNDTFKYHANKALIGQRSRAAHSFITEERTRELELLIHLLSNSRQALIVCGPEGIGKTTLLNVLQEQKVQSWFYCLVQGNADLNLEEIQERMAQAVRQDKPDKQVQGISGVFAPFENRHKKLVLIIDDAGYLVPGLINTIIEYADANSFLRVIFVLTHDDLYVKYKSDSAVDDCCFIEIPPLSERQCGEFLQHLAAQAQPQVSFDAVNDVMIESIYRETQGIPGKIIAELPDAVVVAAKQSENSLSILVGAVAGLVVIALGVQWYSASEYNMPTPITPTVTKQISQSAQINPAVSGQFAADVIDHLAVPGANNESGASQVTLDQALNDRQQLKLGDTQQKSTESLKVTGESDDSKVVNNAGLAASKTPEIIARQQIEPVIEGQGEVADTQDDGERWLITQPVDNYTLQIMVLVKEQSAADVLKKYPLLKDNLKYLKALVNGEERFVLLYGSFSSFVLANQVKQSLPPEFRNSVARKMSAIKNK